jgi:anti-sigma regulatory factor (Ser/Thr protein kinase)
MTKVQPEVGSFILENVENHPDDIVSVVAERFNFSRQRAHTYVDREVKKGTLIKTGQTRATRYFRAGGKHIKFSVKLAGLSEDRVWSDYIKPMVLQYSENIYRTCAYGFTEMLNNAIDHSGGSSVYVHMRVEDNFLCFTIMDNGVGIFQKIKSALNLQSAREAILHLSKGKFTTDPSKHTGEGIFFTSRIFDRFSILSDEMYYTFDKRDWFLSPEKQENFGDGTSIGMRISLDSTGTPKDVMDKYADAEIGFTKTVVAVALSADPQDPHVSRSQAKRLMMGLEKFRHVVLDFKGVESVGQAFVDEVFRVFQNENPTIKIEYFNAAPEVDAMIKRGLATQEIPS